MIRYFGIQYNFFWETEEIFTIMKRVDVKKKHICTNNHLFSVVIFGINLLSWFF